ncbi:MAG: nucleotidyltransferase domain-containing protein, partial [Eubacteriales bacterium]
GLPLRFEQKLCADIDYILSFDIPELKSIILFGSCARKELRVSSDIDLLVITAEPLERSLRGELASVLEEDIDHVKTDCIFYTQEQYINSTRIFTQQIKNEGIVLYSTH